MTFKTLVFSCLTTVALLSTASLNRLSAATAPSLGVAQTFAVLGASAVTNTGNTVIMGDLGVSPSASVTGFPPGVVTMGTIHTADAVAGQAHADAQTAYNFLASEPLNTDLTGQDLGGLTLTPGVYRFSSSAQLTGTLTLNAQGDPNAVFVFQIGTSLTTASNAVVNIINAGIACNVFFQVGSSATLGTGTALQGSILANVSVTLTTNATVSGRVIALTGAVTLDTNHVSVCMPAVAVSGTLQVCKIGAAGILPGTNFTFSVAGTPVVAPAGAAPGGCSPVLVEPSGPVAIAETIPAGIVLTGVASTPAGALVSTNLAAGTATVTVTTGALTVVTFTDAPIVTTGTLQVCKIGAAGVAAGTPFTFSVAGTPTVVLAAAAPGGCSAVLVEPAGGVAITETIPLGIALTGVTSTPPGALVSTNLAAGTATVTITTGALTVVTFTDAAVAVTGLIQVCKVAGFGVTPGSPLTFTIAGTPVVIPAGTCGLVMPEPPGPVVVTEIIPLGALVTGITTLPPAALVSSNLGTGTATVTITTGATTVVTFADALTAIAGGVYQLRYFANLQQADSYIDATNAGTFDGFDPNGRICANFYAYDPREEIVSCCACLITPNGLVSLSVRNDVISNTLTGAPLTNGITVKVLSSLPTPVGGTVCNPASPVVGNLVRGLKLWAVTPHLNTGVTPPPVATSAFQLAETEFASAELSANELAKLTGFCRFLQTASGFGICRSCPTVGAQGSEIQ